MILSIQTWKIDSYLSFMMYVPLKFLRIVDFRCISLGNLMSGAITKDKKELHFLHCWSLILFLTMMLFLMVVLWHAPSFSKQWEEYNGLVCKYSDYVVLISFRSYHTNIHICMYVCMCLYVRRYVHCVLIMCVQRAWKDHGLVESFCCCWCWCWCQSLCWCCCQCINYDVVIATGL